MVESTYLAAGSCGLGRAANRDGREAQLLMAMRCRRAWVGGGFNRSLRDANDAKGVRFLREFEVDAHAVEKASSSVAS